MSFGKQLKSVKENWFLLLVLVVVVLIVSNFNFGSLGKIGVGSDGSYANYAAEDSALQAERGFYPSGDFAPDVETRKIVYSASVGVEIERGEFAEAEREFDGLVGKFNGIVLNENVERFENGNRRVGFYNVQIPVGSLDEFLADIAELGKVESSSKNAYDVTGGYVSLERQLDLERARLAEFENVLEDTSDVSDRIVLIDRIFEQERRIEYIIEALENQDENIEYASVSVTLSEKRSEFADFAFVTFGELVRAFVESVSLLIKLVFVLLPYAIVVWIIWLILKKR